MSRIVALLNIIKSIYYSYLINSRLLGYKYWSVNETIASKVGHWILTKTSSDIEMTSYALLAYLHETNDVAGSADTVRWLVNQSNSLGAYSSTQNTILALQALSTFAIKTVTNSSSKTQVEVEIDVESDDRIKIFNITDENSLVLQSWQFKKCPNDVNIQAKGNGTVFLQLIVSYNIPNIHEPPVFELTVENVENDDSINNLKIKTCVRYIGPNNKTGMSVIESNVLSGFIVNKNELKNLVEEKRVNDLKLVEYLNDENKVAFYFDLLDEEMRCIEWNMERLYPVAASKPVVARVYDYYKPELQVTILFNMLNNTNVCDVSKELANCL